MKGSEVPGSIISIMVVIIIIILVLIATLLAMQRTGEAGISGAYEICKIVLGPFDKLLDICSRFGEAAVEVSG